jgi:hypothetical protein
MKNTIFLFTCLVLSISAFAQHESTAQPRVFFSAGFVAPQFLSGTELTRAYELRQQGLSYFQDQDGTHKSVGSYPANSGFSLSIGYYLPVKKLRGLSVGLLVNSGQTGSSPSEDGYAEGYFFNFVNFSGGFQYYPFANNQLYVKGEVGMGSVFTKNRFLDQDGQQDFLHHFGIGLEAGGALGYTFFPFKSERLGLFVEAQYQYYSTRVEVSGVGNDPWRFGALHLSGGIQF